MNQNLQNQFKKLIRLDHTGSYQTKRTYRQAMGQFLDCCSDHFRAQNIRNLSDKHIRYFVEDQLNNGVSPRTLQKQVAGIRHFLMIAGAKVTVTNRDLGIAGRKGQALKGATNSEYRRALALCAAQGKRFEALAIQSMYLLGLRSNEVVNLRYGSLRGAIKTGGVRCRAWHERRPETLPDAHQGTNASGPGIGKQPVESGRTCGQR